LTGTSTGSPWLRKRVSAIQAIPPAGDGTHRRIEPQQVMLTRIGLHMPQDMTFEHWERTGAQLSGIVNASAWCLGDWLVYGKEQYSNRYQHVVQAVGLDYQTLRNYAWIARRFAPERRRQNLSFQHHAEVASMLPQDQDCWLGQAEAHGWSVKQLRSAIKSSRCPGSDDSTKTAALPRIPVTDRRLARWKQAANHSQIGINQWVIEALDRAAAEALDRIPLTKSD